MRLVRVFFTLIVFISIFIHPLNVFPSDDKPREIVAAVLRNWPPQYLTDRETGESHGFAIDIMNRVAELSGLKVRYVVYEDWSEAVKAVQIKQAVLLPNMGITAGRKKLYNFTLPYETFRISAFVRETTSEIYELSHLLKRKVGAVETNKGLELLIERGASKIEKFESPENLLLALLSGSVDAAVYPESVFLSYAIHAGLEKRIKIIGQPLQEIKRGIAIRKGEQKLFQQLDKAVDRLLKSPEYRSIYEKWYGKTKPFWDLKRVTITLSAIIGLAIVAMFLWRHASITKINKRLDKRIVELKAAREQLNDVILRKNEAVRASNVGLWEWDLVTNKVRFSPEWKRHIGYENHEIGNDFKEWEDRVHPDDLGPTLERVKRSIANRRQGHHAEFRFRHKDGSYRWILSQGSVIQDDSGKPVKMLGSHVDITHLRQVEENLLESESKYRHLFETMTQGVVIQDADGKVIEANQAACEILGLTMDQMLGKTAYDPRWRLIHEDGSPYDPAEMPSNVALRTGKPSESVQCGIYVPEQAEYRWIIIGSVPRFEDGETTPFVTMTVFTDISELHLANNELAEAERQYRALFENLSAGFVLFEVVQDDRGTPIDLLIITANKVFEATTGLKSRDVTGKRLTSVLPGIEKDAADWIGTYGEVALTGKSRQFEQVSELLGTCFTVIAYQPKEKQCAVTFVDITDRKNAEIALRENRELLNTLLQTLPDLVWLKDPEGVYLSCNLRFESFFGAKKADIVGKTDYDFLDKELSDFFREHDRKAIESGEPSINEEEIVFADDGHSEILETIKTPMKARDGQIIGVLGIGRNITDRKHAERLLAESEQRFRMLVENIPDVIVVYDTNLRIQYINPATFNVSGMHPSDFMGKMDKEIWPREIYETWVPMLEESLNRGKILSKETRLKLAVERHLKITCIPLFNEKNEVIEVVGITLDLTDIKRSEKEIRNFLAHLQSKIEDEKIAISREIHDDIGPTLTALKLDIGWIKRRAHPDQMSVVEKLDTMLETIDGSLLTIKKLCIELRPGILDDLGVIAALEWFVSNFQIRTGIHCRLTVVPEDIELPRSYSTALFRITQEALTNVSRHAEASEVDVTLAKDSKQVYLKIEDNGTGITRKSLTRPKSFGIIGMRERVYEIGGDFNIRSENGGGAIVEVRLPAETLRKNETMVKSND